jgi:hypothetical protein
MGTYVLATDHSRSFVSRIGGWIGTVLARNPLENVRNARDVVYVMVNGVLYSGEDAARIHPNPAPTGKMYFAR